MAKPSKRIHTQEDLDCFLKSTQFATLWAFILRLNLAANNRKISSCDPATASPAVRATVSMLDRLALWVDNIPLEPPQQGRFGNAAFRVWHNRLVANARQVLQPVIAARPPSTSSTSSALPDDLVCIEAAAYLCASFGDERRIDYGSGHEAMFAVLLFSLHVSGVFHESDDLALVMLVFPKYLNVTRRLQTKFRLEPAGSHGVWGLDDYSFLPFLWGSAQLLSQQRILPTIVDDHDALRLHASDYLYLDAISFIRDVKKGPFFEHSPMLYDISRVNGGWAKINQGMIRMYRGEVWQKRVVIQHLLFGDIFQFHNDARSTRSPNVAPAVISTPIPTSATVAPASSASSHDK